MECLFTRTHVICATFWDQTILIGEGNTLSAFSSATFSKIGFHVAFPSCNVHGIRTVCESQSSCVCAVFGSRFLTIVKLEPWSAPSMGFQVLLQPVMFDDWIWDIRWLAPDDGFFDPLDEKCMNVAICFGHNGVSLWDWKSKERLAWAVCTESCILYAGHFVGSTWNSLMVAVGTVFKEVILWAPSQCLAQAPARVVHRLSGHQGVIFSVNFNVPRRLLCSTSDDRSLRVYRFHEHPSLCQAGAEDLSLEQLSRGWFSSLHVLYGHESRVWRAAALSSCYISVGEDSSICFWGTPGNLITKMTAPGGGSIWCLAVKEDETLAVTGSSGSAVCIWHLSDVLGHASKTTWIEAFTVGSNFPRNLALVDCFGTMSLLVVTNEGRLLRWILSGRELSMEALLQRDYLVSYSVLSVSPRRNYFAVGSIKGHILVFKCTGGANITLLAEDLVHDGRVHSIRWVSDTCPAFLSSGPNGFMILTQLADDVPSSDELGSVESLSTFLLPRGRQRWATAAILLPPCLFVGDRSGSVHAFLLDDDQDMVEPFRTFHAIHGCNGVTDMKHTEDTLVTSGRDGRILLFSVKNQELRFLRTFWCLTSLEWIGQMVVEGKDLLLCGYHTSNFVVWNTTQQRAVLTVDCGGGHRSWDFAITTSLEGIFVCLKMGKIMLHRSSLKDTLRNSCIRAPLHKKKISAICHLGNEEGSPGGTTVPQAYIVTAGEDNIITVSQVTQEKSNLTQKAVCRLHGHISSVKALAVCKASNLEPSERLLASVGGRAQMILWKVQASKRCSSESEELLNHRLWSLDKGCQRHFKAFPAKDPLARYMDVCIWEEEPLEFRIATVASDTYLRVFGYSWKEDITLLVSIAVGEHCLFKVLRTELVTRPKSSLLLTGGNDGMLRFWQLRGADEKDEGRTECRLLDSFRRHQSGINALDILVHDNIFTVVSGGDDNSLIVTNSVVTEDGAVSELDGMTVANAHDAQITGALFLDAQGKWLMSVGIDQRLRTWHRSSSSVQEHCSRISCVPDLAALTCWKKPDGDILVAIAGEGLEITLHENILAAELATTAGQFIA
ncbi:WD repeat-containing protein 6 isoform X1 [Ixodes scapularis]|uniref:WD repeat-containing protein 6 isoform X1 n=1 Tax=Ixodes scapularis TaxID=6945 RepID=UPI001A9FE63F|nr:WD repeat-containing protein 6 isoform X1 [Ixodes scapularis]